MEPLETVPSLPGIAGGLWGQQAARDEERVENGAEVQIIGKGFDGLLRVVLVLREQPLGVEDEVLRRAPAALSFDALLRLREVGPLGR